MYFVLKNVDTYWYTILDYLGICMMINRIKIFGVIILSFFVWFFWFAFADLEFTDYKILGQIQNDGTINVQEDIDVHFFDQMHGIERKIPWTYTVQDTEFQVFVDDIDVPDYNYKIIDDYGVTNIRIWDADKYVYGDMKYQIDYSIYGLIKNFSGMWYSELYWNVIWYNRNNDINKVYVELTLPKAYNWLTKDDFLITAWYSDKTSIDDFDGEVTRDENKIYITYNRKLDSYNWITLAIRFPNDYFEFNHEKQASLLVWYTHDYNIENYKLFWTIEKSWNIVFHNDIELKLLNEDPYVWGQLPYKYNMDGYSYMTQLRDVSMNWEEKNIEMYDSTNRYATFKIPWNFDNTGTVSAEYSIYGLIKPFSWEFEDWAYRLYLPLPTLNLGEAIKNFELLLDVPWWCDTVYEEDVSVEIWGKIIWLAEYNEKYGHIRCHDNKFAMTYSGEMEYEKDLWLYINFVKWTFELDEELLAWLAALWDGQFYYTDKTNWQSILFAIWILLFSWWFKALMNKRYKKQAIIGKNYPIYYDAPKWVDAPEAWVLVDNKLDPKDLTSLMYQWAINRYIKIFAEADNEKQFYIKKLKQLPSNSKKYQLNLFNSLFKDENEFHFSKDSSSFRTALSTAQKGMNSYIDSQNWYKNTFFSGIWNSFKRQTATLVFWVAILWFVPYFFVLTFINQALVPVSGRIRIVLLVGFILIVSSYRGYKKETNTEEWQEVRNHCLGFKEFLTKVDKVKLETLMEKDPLYIEKVLPYAIVFGVHSQFIKNITPEMIEDWFEWNFDYFEDAIRYINMHNATNYFSSSSYSGHTSYSSSGWFSSGSSFGGWFSSGWGGGWGGWGWW